jgi:hypothetical protein
LGSSDVDLKITTDEWNSIYSGSIYIGSKNEKFHVYLDTGSNKLILFDKDIYIWNGTTFDSKSSTTFNNTGKFDEISYEGGQYLYGYKSTDRVSFTYSSSYEVHKFNFLLGIY